jgi:tRNA pseudouridine-54 N-methylase
MMIKKAFVFDFDDTLATTKAMVEVKANGKTVKALTPAQFNTYQLAQGESFCYNQFRDIVHIEAAQILSLGSYAKQLTSEKHDLYILTARADCVAEAIQKKLAENGIAVKCVHCVGKPNVNISEEKRKVLLTLIESYHTIYFYDDDAADVEEANSIGVNAKVVK